MLDLYDLPGRESADFQVFYGDSIRTTSVIANPRWHAWHKPRGVSMVYMVAIGGGGASGQVATLLVPAFFLPDTLHIQCGQGGHVYLPSPGNNGAGGNTHIAVIRSTDPYNCLLAAGGGTPVGLTAATGCVLSNMGFAAFIAGQSGTNGGAGTGGSGTAGVDQTLSAALPFVAGGTGGGGGGNLSGGAAGGRFNNALNGLIPGGGLGAINGFQTNRIPFFFMPGLGGTGGQLTWSHPDQNGTHAAYGSGGGGGGGGNTGSTGTPGGGGVAMIWAW